MATDFFSQLDNNRQPTGAIPQSSMIYNVVLGAGVMQSIAVPSGYDLVLFSGDEDFWCRFDANVVVPATTSTTGAGGELNPESRVIRDVTTIRLIAASATKISLAFYKIHGTNHMTWAGNAPT